MGKFGNQIRWDITRSVTLASVFYFLYFAGKTCLLPYLTLYFRKLGLTGSQTGIVCGTKSFVWFLAAPFWTVLAKRFGKTRLILGTSVLIALASHLSLTLVSPINDNLFSEDCHHFVINPTASSMKDLNSDHNSDAAINLNSTQKNISGSVTQSSIMNVTNLIRNSTKAPFASGLDKLVKELKTVKTSTVLDNSSKTTTHFIKSTTASTALVSPTPTLTIYKMALHLLPQVIADDPDDVSDIKELLSNYSETRMWPKWKRIVLSKKIVKLLENQPDEDIHEASAQLPTPLTSVKLPTTSPSNSTSPDLDDDTQVIVNMVDDLIPDYLQRKEDDPSLTILDFLDEIPNTETLPYKMKLVLRNIFLMELKKKVNSRNKRSAMKSVEENFSANQSYSNQTLNLTLPTTEAVTSETLVESLLPKITDNISTFLIILFIIIAGETLAAPVEILSDSSFYELLDELDSLSRYGRHKVYAVVATMISGLAISSIIYFSPCILAGSISRFNLHFYAYATLLCLAFLVVPFYPNYTQKSNQLPRSNPVSLCPTCRIRLCSECRHILLLITVFIVGIMQAGLQDFLLWQIHDLPHASEIVYGSYVSANALASLLALPIGRRITTMLQSSVTVPISLCSIASQMLLCSFINNAWMVVPLQVLTITGPPFLWVVVNSELKMMMLNNDDRTSLRALDQVHIFAKSSQKRSMYIAYLCTYQGIAFSIGSFVSGFTYDASGGSLSPFLRVGSAAVLGWAVLYFTVHCCCIRKRKQRSYSQLLDDSEDELETFNLKSKESSSSLNKPKSKYVENGRKVAESRRKRRNRNLPSSSDEDELEQEWSAMNRKKDSRRM